MRISEKQRYEITNTRVEGARSTNATVLERLSTLRNINRISDDPIGTGKVVRGRDRIKNLEQLQKNIEFAKGYLERTETAVVGISENLMRAKELSVNLANATFDGDSRAAAGRELGELINDVVALGNTAFANRYVFSGYRTQTPTLSADGEFLGDDGAIFLQIDDGNYRQLNVQARYLFEADPEEQEKGHFNMIDALGIINDGFKTNDVDAIRKGMDELDFQIEKTTSYHATIGSLHNALESALKAHELDEDLSRQELSKVEEIDMFKATADFHRTESILQSTLLASNKMLQPSLLNFLQ